MDSTKELDFYRSLTVSRDKGVTSIDGGKTAEKLHKLWEDSQQLVVAQRELGDYHLMKYALQDDLKQLQDKVAHLEKQVARLCQTVATIQTNLEQVGATFKEYNDLRMEHLEFLRAGKDS